MKNFYFISLLLLFFILEIVNYMLSQVKQGNKIFTRYILKKPQELKARDYFSFWERLGQELRYGKLSHNAKSN